MKNYLGGFGDRQQKILENIFSKFITAKFELYPWIINLLRVFGGFDPI
jgi:hypothetical protein